MIDGELDLEDYLGQLFGRPRWHRRAACRGMGPDVFFNATSPTARQRAADTCAGCPVTAECRQAGEGEADGVWGGLRWTRQGRKAA